jgi:ABC-2 type transport system ATP-binding protein
MYIELTQVHKRFGSRHVLRGVDLRVCEGSRVALIGPNGSGKSTLLRALMGMLEVEGHISVAGLHPFFERRRLAQELAYVPQIAPHLGAPVREVVRASCALRGIHEARVSAVAQELELDLSMVYAAPFSSLSGGMRQKVLIALAFASAASLYILDEPTASLDVKARARFAVLLAALPKNATVLLCSHHSEEVQRLADRVVELSEGVFVPVKSAGAVA